MICRRKGVPGMGAVSEMPDADGAAERGPVRVEVENFGPIRQGAVTLKPLTVFIGPNNSGKSYMAMLVHALHQAHAPLGGMGSGVLSSGPPPGGWRPEYRAMLESIAADLSATDEAAIVTLPPALVAEAAHLLMLEVYGDGLDDALERDFASEPEELISQLAESALIGLEVGGGCTQVNLARAGNGQLEVVELPALSLGDAKIDRHVPTGRWQVVIGAAGSTIGSAGRSEPTVERIELALRAAVRRAIDEGPWERFSEPCHYIPATRSGMMQVHRTLAAGIIEQATTFGNGASARGVLTGATADLISTMLRLEPSHSGAFSAVMGEFERTITGGEVVAETLAEFAYPTISYRLNGMSIPLHRASSAVSELAPIILMLKHTIEQGDVAIIEEPEAHLHPANQAKLAHLLVRLVRRGLRLIITTHSDYLLEQLGNFVMLSGVTAESRRDRYGYHDDDYLQPDDVGVYLFKPDEQAGGHVIEPVTVDPEDGIYLDEFLGVNEVLYDETVRIHRELFDQ